MINSEIKNNICYTDLVFERVNKKLSTNMSRVEIQDMVLSILNSADSLSEKIGKNYYISNLSFNIRLTVNSFTYRLITVDRL
ncbi:DUF3781 domain-containing protein [Companilactobacillus jidongensis]|uniref:DUF3781 domain-containing protein n=1 Tax=Companilactobacillus jidongensis TaxID=2486006 RepID=UPI000F774EBC|nr:DUF3781 domain-containing protein [Companilactobacillus jidongensis]